MQTKIVYVVVADKDSIYLEQAYVSVWSLKYYNPDASVTFVMDNRTKKYWDMCGYDELKTLVDEVIVREFEDNATNHYRSRWLKTSLRTLLQGDFLFLDTDTIVIGDIGGIDDFNDNIGMVEDLHQPNLSTCRYLDFIINKTKQIGWSQFNLSSKYYNSGIIVAKDTLKSRDFFQEWHKNWKYSYSRGVNEDQLSLNYTNLIKNGISSVNPIYHCQLLGNGLKYFHNALIIHYFNSSKFDNKGIKPFFLMEDNMLQNIRLKQCLPSEITNRIKTCEDFFPSQIDLISGISIPVYYSRIFRALAIIYAKYPSLYNLAEKTLSKLSGISFKSRSK